MSDCCGDSTFNCTLQEENCFNCTCSCYKEFYALANVDSFCKLVKSLPGENCTTAEDCLDGLVCFQNTTCACTAPCLYDDTNGVCDCGGVNFEVSVSVILMGLFLGFLSIFIWIFCIIKTLHRGNEYKTHFPSRSVSSVTPMSDFIEPSILPTISSEQQCDTENTQPLKDINLQTNNTMNGIQEVSVSHGVVQVPSKYSYYEPVKGLTTTDESAPSSSNRQRTPNPYAALERNSTPLQSAYIPTAPVVPQYPTTLLSPEETKNIKYFS